MDKYIGKRLDGRYEIKEIVGVGGMAYVYKAYDKIDDRIVAVKILKDEYLSNEDFTRRFRNESKAIAILSHPNIVKVYDVSFGQRFQYIVMEYVDGITLKEYIEQQKDIKWKEAVHFTVQILRALQHAHDKGIVHRDIKPQNIMLLTDGTVKVTDFGIARFSRHEMRNTKSSEKAIGSVHYISPEQARGDITDEKADIYSLGVMMYEMLTGQLPFEAESAVSVAIMQMQKEAKPPRQVNPDIPEGLEEITVKAMQKDPAKRYQSAAEMLYDIDEFKKNPAIHFEYKYFVDETPTRFIEHIGQVRGEEEPADVTNEVEEKNSPPFLPILAAVAGAVVLVAMLFVGAVMLFGMFGGEATEDIVVPDFVGMNYYEDDFSRYLSVVTIDKDIQTMYSEDGLNGYIYKQEPEAGLTKKMGTEVTLYVYIGAQTVQVPTIGEGSDLSEVVSILQARGFDVQEIKESSETVQEGKVIRIDPSTEAAVGSTIRVYVSNGKAPLPDEIVPNLIGATQDDAMIAAAAKNFVVKADRIKVVNHDKYGEGVVIDQSPKAGEPRQPGTEIVLTVSSGYKDVKDLIVDLPDTTTTVDLKVYVDGTERKAKDLGVETLTGLLPADMDFVVLQLKEKKESYTVTVKIAATDVGKFADFRTFIADGVGGTARENLDRYKPFVEPPSTSATTTTKPDEAADGTTAKTSKTTKPTTGTTAAADDELDAEQED